MYMYLRICVSKKDDNFVDELNANGKEISTQKIMQNKNINSQFQDLLFRKNGSKIKRNFNV